MKLKLDIINKMLFPEGIKCIVCDSELCEKNRFSLCLKCVLSPNIFYCDTCGRAFVGKDSPEIAGVETYSKDISPSEDVFPSEKLLCEECLHEAVPYDAARSPHIYENHTKDLVYRFKYGNARYLAKYMAGYMADSFYDSGWNVDVITFVPMSTKRKRRRGYNQAQLLAAELSRLTGLPAISVLEKTADIKNAARMTRSQRLEALRGSISLAADDVMTGMAIKGKSILLVDDVFTTGATSGECCRVLKTAGASAVYVLTFATSKLLRP